MGRWSGLSGLIDSGKSSVNVTTRYHKLDDSIFVLCRNCGHSTTKKEELSKKMDGINKLGSRNPKNFLTWSATTANNRLQKMSKTFANNITRLQLKMEKAIPFQQGVGGSGEFCSNKSCENGKLSNNDGPCCGESSDNNNCGGGHNHKTTSCPDVVNVSKLMSGGGGSSMSTILHDSDSTTSDVTDKLINKLVVNQLGGEIGRYHYDSSGQQSHNNTRIQSARIVASHPSVSQAHSQGSVANPDKIIQINVESYNVYSEEIVVDAKVTSSGGGGSNDEDLNVNKSGNKGSMLEKDNDDTRNKSKDKMLDMQSHLDLFYDSGTGSANTSISGGSSLSSPNVTDLPVNTSLAWNRAAIEKSLSSSCNPNLNSSSSPSVMSQKKRGHDSNGNKNDDDAKGNQLTTNTTAGNNKKKVNNGSSSSPHPGENTTLLVQDSNNSTNSGVCLIESTDERSLLIENNKSNSKRNGGGLRNGSSSGANNNHKNVEICNNKNSVAGSNNKPGNLESLPKTALRLKSLKSQSYPPSSKLGVTIFEKETDLRDVAWLQLGIPRDLALEILRNEPIGSFIVRESSTKPGCFALSLRVPKDYQPCGFANYLILKSSRGYKIKGFTKEFTNLSSLITHHTVMKELLPCPLSLHPYEPPTKSLRVSRANSSDFMDLMIEQPEKLFIGKYTDF